jgi:hypothetical protein
MYKGETKTSNVTTIRYRKDILVIHNEKES